MTALSPTQSSPYDTQQVVYRQLDGGLNTRKALHDLARNEFGTLVNLWYAYGSAPSKRPGSTAFIGALPDGGNVISIVTARFSGVTYILAQSSNNHVYYAATTDSAWSASIGTLTGGTMRAAQMYDPKTGKDTLFIVDGVDTPQMWQGPATTLVAVTTGAGFLPNKPNTVNPITPAYVATLGNNSHLFYSGESTAPSAVYISDAFNPESFSTPAMQADPYGYTGGGGTFAPAVIGMNDGVDGGSITGLQTLGFAMVIFKESAIYAMVQTQLLGNVAWQVYNVSPNRGALSPRSIVAFDGFIVFLSIDGVYITFGQPSEQMNKQKISGNVPSFFDSTRFGQAALIQNRTTAVAGRIANRYMIFFDVGTGHPTAGVWFDFDVTADQQLPAAGQISGMTVSGIASASGPNDQGLFYWGDPTASRVGLFGVGFSDFGNAITARFSLKSDAFEPEFGTQAPIVNKVPSRCSLAIEPLSVASGNTQLQFQAAFNADHYISMPAALPLPEVFTPASSGQWGQNWGAMQWTSSQIAGAAYNVLIARPQRGVVGHVIQMAIIESSTFPWILVALVLEVNQREISQ